MSKDSYIEKAIQWASKKSVASIKAKHDDYEDPKVYTNNTTNEEVQADLSFITQGGAKHYTDIALKSDKPQKLVTRWKLLSLVASLKNGKLFLLAPKGHKTFTKKLVEQYNINAVVYSL